MVTKRKISAAIAAAALMALVSLPDGFAQIPENQQSEDVISDEIVIRYKSEARVADTYSSSQKLNVVTTAVLQANIFQLDTATANSRSAVPISVHYQRQIATGDDVIKLSRSLTAEERNRLVMQLDADPRVQSVSFPRRINVADQMVERFDATTSVPNDPGFMSRQWNLRETAGGINMPNAWAASTGKGSVVAVLDTGIIPPGHRDMPANVLQGYDFIYSAKISGRTDDGRVPGGVDTGDWVRANQCGGWHLGRSSSWHGTHVAGVVASATNNGIGGAGVAYDATILPIRILGHCGGTETDLVDAIVWAAGGKVEGIPDNRNPAEVINLSLTGRGACESGSPLQRAIDLAVSKGSTVVAAAGNDNRNAGEFFPGNCQNVITVGANRITGGRTYYSNYGAMVDVSAPGGGGRYDLGNWGWDGYIYQIGYSGKTTNVSGEYNYRAAMGTSAAVPHVAGTVALVQSALVAARKKPLAPRAMRTLIRRTARVFPIAPPGGAPIGAGIVDPRAAIDSALRGANTGRDECKGAECGRIRATELENGKRHTILAGLPGSEKLFSFEAKGNAPLTFMTFGGTGNLSMYVSFEGKPAPQRYDIKSAGPGNFEYVIVRTPRTGTYYVSLVGESGYLGASLLGYQYQN